MGRSSNGLTLDRDYGDDPEFLMLLEALVGAAEVSDGNLRGVLAILDLAGRPSGTNVKKGNLYLVDAELAADIIGGLVQMGAQAWGDDLATLLRTRWPAEAAWLRGDRV